MGVLGCVSCIVGSIVIVIHAPQERTPSSVQEVWNLATEPGSSLPPPSLSLQVCKINHCLVLLDALVYSICYICGGYIIHCASADATFRASLWSDKRTGLLGDMFLDGGTYGICFLLNLDVTHTYVIIDKSYQVYSIFIMQVVSIKAIGIAIKLTLEGINQFGYAETWFFLSVAVVCVIMQLNYLNKVVINKT